MAKDDKDAKGKKDAKPAGKPAQDAKPAVKEKAAKQPKGEKPVGKQAAPTQPARLNTHYVENVVPALMKQFGYKTKMQVPRVTKITLNMGVGEAVADKKIMDNAVGDMKKIAGQTPVVTLSRKSVAGFKIRDGYPVGTMVTLRSFDSRGNYNMGIKEQIIFPEIEYDKVDAIRGMNISITTTAKTDEEARALLAAFRFPFRTERAA